MPRTLARRTSYGLLAVFALLAPAAIVGTWAQRHLIDERGYLHTVAPLSSDPRVQQAVTSAVTTQVVAALPIRSITASLPPALSGIGQAAKDAATSAVGNAVADVTASPQFASVWLSANRSAHAQLSEILTATPGTNDVSLKLDLQPVVDAVQQHLVDNGYSILRGVHINVGGQTAVVTVPQSDLGPARDAWTTIRILAPWLPLVALVLAVGAIVLAPQRSWMLLAEAGALLAGVGAVALAATGAHAWYIGHVQQSSAAAVAIGDALGHSISQWLREVTIAALVLAIVAFVGLWFREVRLGRPRRLQAPATKSA
jgi:hypothetical protein